MTLRTQMKGAALAIGLALTSMSAQAQVVTLVCQKETGSYGTESSFTLRVDYDRKRVDLLAPDGTTVSRSAGATITEGTVEWAAGVDGPPASLFRGELNRLSGQGRVLYALVYGDGGVLHQTLAGPCGRATQKF